MVFLQKLYFCYFSGWSWSVGPSGTLRWGLYLSEIFDGPSRSYLVSVKSELSEVWNSLKGVRWRMEDSDFLWWILDILLYLLTEFDHDRNIYFYAFLHVFCDHTFMVFSGFVHSFKDIYMFFRLIEISCVLGIVPFGNTGYHSNFWHWDRGTHALNILLDEYPACYPWTLRRVIPLFVAV